MGAGDKPSKKPKQRVAVGGEQRASRFLFSQQQVSMLEQRFREQSFLSREERAELAEQVGITERQVMVWFQNRRWELSDTDHFL